MRYWDTSALLKLYVPEPDSAYFLDLISTSDEPVVTSAIAAAEVLCALFRKESATDLRPDGARALFRRFRADSQAGRILLVPHGVDLLQEMEKLARLAFEMRSPILIRSLDLIHLASAALSRATALVATVQRVRNLGALLGMELLP